MGNLILGFDLDLPNIVKLFFTSEEIFFDSWKIYKKFKGKKLSFTDASIISFMNKYKIDNLCSFDDGFDGILNRIF